MWIPIQKKPETRFPIYANVFLQGAKDVKTFGTGGTNRIEVDKDDIEYEESSYHIKNDKDHTQEISKTKSISFGNRPQYTEVNYIIKVRY